MIFLSNVFKLYFQRFDFFLNLLVEHIFLTFVAILITTIIGVSSGVYLTRNQKLASLVFNITNFVYTIPSIALFGILVSITGIGKKSALIALVVYGLLPIIRNTYVGIKGVDAGVLEAANGMGSSNMQILFGIELPLALPVIFSGFRTMVIMTIALGGIASFIGAGGLGVAIWRGITTNFSEMTVAGSLLVAFLAILTDLALGRIETILLRKGR